MVVYGPTGNKEITVTAVAAQTSITISEPLTLSDNLRLNFSESLGVLRLETGTATATDLGHKIISDSFQITSDTYSTGADQMALEEATVDTGEITRVFVDHGGGGYTFFPTITLNPTRGTTVLKTNGSYLTPTTANLIATTTDIGGVSKVKITDVGANYSSSSIPPITLRANFVLKDVSGAFAAGELLTSHTGTVKSYDTNTQVLQTTLEDVVRSKLETTDALPIGLEDNLSSIESYITLSGGGTSEGFYNEGLPLSDIHEETDGGNIILNASGLDGDAFIELEDDTGGVLLAEPALIDDPLTIELEDGLGKLTIGDTFTKKFIRQIPKGRRPKRFLNSTSDFKGFGTYVRALTHNNTATAAVNGTISSSKLLAVDGNSGTIVVGMTVSDTGVSAVVNGTTNSSDTVSLESNIGQISIGMTVSGANVDIGTTVTAIAAQSSITFSNKLSLTDDTLLTFKFITGITVSSVTSQTKIVLSSAVNLTDNTNPVSYTHLTLPTKA